MENATKAIIIAGSALLLILVFSVMNYVFQKMAGYASDVYDITTETAIAEYNQKLINYETGDGNYTLTIQDVISIINIVKDNNSTGGVGIDTTVKTPWGTEPGENMSSSELEEKLIDVIENGDPGYSCKLWYTDGTESINYTVVKRVVINEQSSGGGSSSTTDSSADEDEDDDDSSGSGSSDSGSSDSGTSDSGSSDSGSSDSGTSDSTTDDDEDEEDDDSSTSDSYEYKDGTYYEKVAGTTKSDYWNGAKGYYIIEVSSSEIAMIYAVDEDGNSVLNKSDYYINYSYYGGTGTLAYYPADKDYVCVQDTVTKKYYYYYFEV